MFGRQTVLPGMLRMRLSEHALHTWDIVVALEPAATVAGDAVGLIVDSLPMLAQWAGRGGPEPVTVHSSPLTPGREFRLELTADRAGLAPADGPGRCHRHAPAAGGGPGPAGLRQARTPRPHPGVGRTLPTVPGATLRTPCAPAQSTGI